jgi:hypothetical protein
MNKYQSLDVSGPTAQSLLSYALWMKISDRFKLGIDPITAELGESVGRNRIQRHQINGHCLEIEQRTTKVIVWTFNEAAAMVRGRPGVGTINDWLSRRFNLDPNKISAETIEKALFHNVSPIEAIDYLKLIVVHIQSWAFTQGRIVLEGGEVSTHWMGKLNVDNPVAQAFGREALFDLLRKEFRLEPQTFANWVNQIARKLEIDPNSLTEYVYGVVPVILEDSKRVAQKIVRATSRRRKKVLPQPHVETEQDRILQGLADSAHADYVRDCDRERRS